MILEVELFSLFLELLKFLLPALVVFLVAYKLIDQMLEDNRHARLMAFKKEHSQQITPIKLQAYERLTLFLDRIRPDNLVLRLSKSGQTAEQLRQLLVQTITDEYNHNISQQIYVSNQAWELVTAVKEQVINIVEACYKECEPNSSGPTLGKAVLKRLMSSKQVPTQAAIELIKKEVEIVF